MPDLRYIDKTYIESPDFQEPQEDLTLRISLSDGQQVLFTAEKQFYTPRRIATNLTEVVQLENIVEYSPNNVAIVKLQNGQTILTKPQYYLNSIVRDVYKQYPLDTFFTELDDELSVPEYIGTDFEKRQLALNTLLNLEDLAAGVAANDADVIIQATDDIDNNFSELAGLEATRELTAAELTTPQENDQLASLDFAGLTDGNGDTIAGISSNQIAYPPSGETKVILPDGSVIVTPLNAEELGLPVTEIPSELPQVPDENNLFTSADTSADIINPVPTVDETALISMNGGLPTIAGEIPGLQTVNQAIELLNVGTQQVEGTLKDFSQGNVAGQEDCKYIIVAKGKRGRFGIGRFGGTPERKVLRKDIENKLALVKNDIAQQEQSNVALLKTSSGTPTLVKIQKFSLFSKLISNLNSAGVLSELSKTVGKPTLITATTSSVPSGYQPLLKEQILKILNKTKTELEGILAQGC